MIDSFPLSLLLDLERSALTLVLAVAFVVLLPTFFLLLRQPDGDALSQRRLLLATAILGAMLLLPFAAAGVSLILPSSLAAAEKAAPDGTRAASSTRTPTSATKEKTGATTTRATPAPTRAAASVASPGAAAQSAQPRPTQTARPEPTATATPDRSKQLAAVGQTIFQRERCTTCHSINGRGGSVGPDLAGVGTRRSAAWIMDHFKDPQALSPGTMMPKFNLPDEEFEALTAYLLTLAR